MKSIISKVLKVAETAQPRNIENVMLKVQEEVGELATEVNVKSGFLGQHKAGKDGILGEACDSIIALLDIIYLDNPNVTEEDIAKTIKKKVKKWVNRNTNNESKKESVFSHSDFHYNIIEASKRNRIGKLKFQNDIVFERNEDVVTLFHVSVTENNMFEPVYNEESKRINVPTDKEIYYTIELRFNPNDSISIILNLNYNDGNSNVEIFSSFIGIYENCDNVLNTFLYEEFEDGIVSRESVNELLNLQFNRTNHLGFNDNELIKLLTRSIFVTKTYA
ncbi:gp295 [Sphingomonas phage PAU]|uniref:MazG-like pyrophosphatase n=1 Tax=Sphingomonas phage PAU TaxID=1150991 RepID=UPI00025734A6|nr:MazG-like pyrophosphatase [Sphingomonas phage PAU]AFF28292.1 gp295 [Sphingomonas phage PAU]